jgi:hypothetical protein
LKVVLSVNGTRNYFAVALRGGYDSLDSHTSASDSSDADSADGRFQWSLALTVLCGLASSDNAKVRSGLSQERGLHQFIFDDAAVGFDSTQPDPWSSVSEDEGAGRMAMRR